MKLSLVLSTQPARFQAVAFRGDLESGLASIAALGYDGVELAVRDPSMVDLDQLRALLSRCRLEVPAIGTGQAWGEEGLSFTDPDPSVRRAALGRLQDHIHFASHWRALVILGLIRGTVQPGVERQRAMEWLRLALQDGAAAAAQAGVRLALEPINRYETTLVNTVAEGLELVDSLGSDRVGLLLDTFHMNIEEPSIVASIRQAGNCIYHLHVADSNRWHPGAGHLDFEAVLGALGQAGYRGWVSGEFMPLPDPETAARNAVRHLRLCGARVAPSTPD